ncbi:MAG TPA: TRAP transporter small permease subunit [Longimicrobiales bacterium]|nr:TRAP transporter small permease subunit [Longimicrobiales bacterium]
MNPGPPRDPASLRVARAIDRLTGGVGAAVAWLALFTVLLGAFNAIARYLGRYLGVHLSSNAWIELQWYLFSVMFLLGGAWVLREDAHVRVDVLFARLSARSRAMIDIAGILLLLVPFAGFIIWVTVPVVQASWRIREGSPDPGGLPRYPLKALILVSFGLLLLQAVALLIRRFHDVRSPHPVRTPEP